MEGYSLEPTGPMDMTSRLVIILGLLGWNILEGLSLRTPYPTTMVALWSSPIWRFTLLMGIWLGAEWCPRVGLMTAVAVLFYVVNMVQIVN